MIDIHYQGTDIRATDDGVPVLVPTYWTQEILDGIQAAFEAGDYTVIPDPEPPPPTPDWEKFIQQFTLPGNPLYHATATKVQQSGEMVIEHWTNIRLGLLSPSIRNEEWFQSTFNYLKYLLEQSGNSLSNSELTEWLDLAKECNINLV